jgi:lactoylglutathione lyase
VRTLHTSYRVSDLSVSLDFYIAVGYTQVGRVDLGGGASLTMLNFPGEEVVTLELVHRPAAGAVDIGTGFSHIPVQVDDLRATLARLSDAGLKPGPVERPGGQDGPQVSWLTDPDGYRIELVQWPPGHAYGITAADFQNETPRQPRR